MDLQHPAIQSSVVPLVLAFVLAGLLRLLGGKGRGPLLASAAIGLALLVVVEMVQGGMSWPPVTAAQKLPYVLAAGLLLGASLDFAGGPRLFRWLAILLWPALALGWLAAPRLEALAAGVGLELGVLYLGAVFVLWRLEAGRARGLDGPAMLLAGSLGLGVLAALSASISLAQLAFALAAAAGGFMLWNWPVHRWPFGLAGVLGAGGAFLALATQTLLYTPAKPPAVAALVLVFLLDGLARRLPPRAARYRELLQPVYVVLLAVLVVALALGLSLAGVEDDYGYY